MSMVFPNSSALAHNVKTKTRYCEVSRGLTAVGDLLSIAVMNKILALAFVSLFLAAPSVLADDRLSAPEMRKVMPGTWSGNYKKSAIVLSIGADGSVKGHYAGVPARGSWTTKRAGDGDRICLTFRSIVSDTKCGELFRKGNNVLYGYLNRGKPRLWLRRKS